VPGKLWKLDPGDRPGSPRVCPKGRLISATNGKTTTAAMAAGSCRTAFSGAQQLRARNSIGCRVQRCSTRAVRARLSRSMRRAARDRRAGKAESRCLGNLSRRARPLRRRRERRGPLAEAVARVLPGRDCARSERDRSQLGALRGCASPDCSRFGVDDPEAARPSHPATAADRKYCVRCGTTRTTTRPAYIGTPRRAVTGAPMRRQSSPLDGAARRDRCWTARVVSFTLATPGASAVCAHCADGAIKNVVKPWQPLAGLMCRELAEEIVSGSKSVSARSAGSNDWRSGTGAFLMC